MFSPRCTFRLYRSMNSRSVGNLCQQRLSSGWSDDSFSADSTELPQRRSEKSVNQVTLLGRVGRDSETRGSFSHPVIIFPLATNYSFANAEGQMVSRVDWHRISVFRQNLRDFVAVNIRKGDRLMVMGSLRYDRLGEGENSTMVTTIIANDIVNLTKKFLDEPQAESSEEF